MLRVQRMQRSAVLHGKNGCMLTPCLYTFVVCVLLYVLDLQCCTIEW